VCSYCEKWKDECLEREQTARKILSLPRDEGTKAYKKIRDSGIDMTKLDSVIKRLKNDNQ
jgi:hypothetical protein